MLKSTDLTCISYNSDDFFENVANKLLKARKITFWAYINHLPEKGEASHHKHCLFFPGCRLETNDLEDDFCEPDPDPNQDLPLKAVQFRTCENIYTWFLYVIHDRQYCIHKFAEPKMFEYTFEDIKCSDKLILSDMRYKAYHEVNVWKNKKYIDLLDTGHSPESLVRQGYVEMKDMNNFKAMSSILGK